MTTNVFLDMDGVDGESADDRHHGEIEVLSWSFGVSNSGTAHMGGGGAGAGKASISDLSVTKLVDIASPALLQAAATGKRLKTATISARKAGEGQRDFLIITMREVMVTSCALAGSGEGDAPTEAVTLSFGKVQLTYTAQAPDGSAGPTTSFGWDVTKNGPI